jgi:predicted PurR-regulated permease PerM
MPQASRAVIVLLSILATVMVGWVLHAAAGILQPLVIALLLASMLQPLVRRLAQWRVPPALTVMATIAVLFVALVYGGLLLQSGVASFLGADSTPVLPGPRIEMEAPAEAPAETPSEAEEATSPSADGGSQGGQEAGEEEVDDRPSWDLIKQRLRGRMV